MGIAALVAVAVVAGLVWYRVGVGGASDAPSASTATTREAPLPSSSVPASSPTRGGAGGVIVHVAGAVTKPGVVELVAGARVIDALEAAGGAAPDADLDRLNLAAKLADGERVLVQRVGEAPVVGGEDPSGAPGTDAAPGGLLNLNTATPAQLEELPGIGPVLAAAIAEEREQRGGFRSVNELRDVRGIGDKRFEDLRNQVVV